MYLQEHQAKEVFRREGLPTPAGAEADGPEEAREAAEGLGPCVLKALVRAGGRGKAGLIRIAETPDEAEREAGDLLGRVHQGEVVERLLVEERLAIEQELYLGLVLNAPRGRPEALLSLQGGMEIEQIAATDPEALVRLDLDPLGRLTPAHAWVEAWKRAGLSGSALPKAAGIGMRLESLFHKYDALTAEINPLALLSGGRLVAADAKLMVDDAALFRHPDLKDYRKEKDQESLEARASRIGVSYVSLDPEGTVGIIAGGAGLSMATMDGVVDAGIRPAAFLDLGGGISEEGMAESVRIMLATPGLKGLIINVFGGINNCGIMARGVARVRDEIKDAAVVVKMRGHSQDEGWAIIEELGLTLVRHEATDEAISLLMSRLSD